MLIWDAWYGSEMNALLISPPFSSPSAMPYQLADIKGYLLARGIKSRIDVWDFNIELFNNICAKDSYVIKDLTSFLDYDIYIATIYPIYNSWLAEQQRVNQFAEAYLKTDAPEFANYIAPYFVERINNYDVFAFSLTYHLAEGFSQFYVTMAMSKYIKSIKSDAKIAVGGALLNHFELNKIMDCFDFIDVIFLKESEESLCMFLNGTALPHIPNITYRDNSGVACNPFADNVERNLAYLPNFEDIPILEYLTPFPVASLQYKRGCAWNKCTFCTSNLSYFCYEKSKDPDLFIGKLIYLKNKGVRFFYISDQMLLPHDLDKLLPKLRSLDIVWAFMAKPEPRFTPDFMERLYSAGCRWITWGIESASEKVLVKMNKKINIATAKDNIIASHTAGIQNALLVIYGFPGEKRDDFNQTLEFLKELTPYYYANSFSKFEVLSGAYVYNNRQEFDLEISNGEVVFQNDTYTIWSNQFCHVRNTETINYEALLPKDPRTLIPLAEHFLLYCAHFRVIP